MATSSESTVIPEPTTTTTTTNLENVEKMVNEEVKAVDDESTPPPEENGGAFVEVNQETEKLATPEASITEQKTVDEQVDTHAVAVENVDDAPVLEVPIADVPKDIDDVNVSAVSVPVVEAIEKEPEEQIRVSDVPTPEAETVEMPAEVVPVMPAPEEVIDHVAEAQEVDKPVEEVPLAPAPEELITPVVEANEVNKQVEVAVLLTAAPEQVIAPTTEAREVDVPVDVVPRTPATEEVMAPVAEDKIVEVVTPTPASEEVIAPAVEDKPVEVLTPTPTPEEVITPVAEDKPIEVVTPSPASSEVITPIDEAKEVDKPVEVVPLTPAPEVMAPVIEDKAVEVVAPTPAPEVITPVAEDKPVEVVSPSLASEEVITPIAVIADDELNKEVPPTLDPLVIPELEAKMVEQPESVIAVEEKAPEQFEVTTDVESKSEVNEPKEAMGDEVAKDGELLVKKDEDVTEATLKEQTDKDLESAAFENVDTVVSANHETLSDPIDGQVSAIPDIVEPKKEEIKGDVVQELVRADILEEGKVEEQKPEKKGEVEESKILEANKIEETSNSISSTKVTEHASRNLDELILEEKKEESMTSDAKPSVEANKDRDMDEKEVTVTGATTAPEPVAVPKELVLQEKEKDSEDSVVNKLNNVPEAVEDIAKYDAPSLESSKDVADTKTEGEASKEEVPVKTTPKHSNNLISKVKQSIVKVKKAIIGKSPSSKTISSNAKDDIEVK